LQHLRLQLKIISHWSHQSSIIGHISLQLLAFVYWATVCKMVRPIDRCPVLSVPLVYCGQTVGLIVQDETWHGGGHRPQPHFWTVCCGQTGGWIKMQLGRGVELDPGDVVLRWGFSSPKGTQPPIFGPCPLWPNGWIDQDATYGGRPRPRQNC